MKPYDHVYLSPHFDDAALSCGGSIHQQGQRGEPVLVVTVCAAPPGGALSPFARKIHAAMGDPDDVVAMRRREDRTAMERLGASFAWLDFQDAIYRVGEQRWLYTHLTDVFGSVHPDDPLRSAAIAEALRKTVPRSAETTLYAPLGVGRHVDHQLVHQAAWRLRGLGWRVLFYEDYPYSDPAYRLLFGEENTATLAATLAALKDADLAPCLVRLSEADVQARIDSIGAYRSQVSMLFGDEATPADRVRAFTRQVDGRGPAERVWEPG